METVQQHLRRAGDLIGARRLPEGELAILRALEADPRDLRALKLLALVRYRLGRVAEARQTFRTAREAAPDDAGVRLGLGLVALKMEWFDEAVAELEMATRLGPSDTRAWNYLGYAYSRSGSPARAAAAFGRADRPAAPIETTDSAAGFAQERLVSGRSDGDVVALRSSGEAHARQATIMATVGDLAMPAARRRFRGRVSDQELTGFVVCQGAGEIWLSCGDGLIALTLEDDLLYLREDRVAAWSGELTWEAGSLPGGPPLLQFRGSGRVVMQGGRLDQVVSLRVGEGDLVSVPAARLLGWLGRVVARATDQVAVACEGEGVLLLSKHAHPAQRVHQRAEPGDDGASAARPDRAAVHR
jgi:hypothetical protein